LRFQLKKILIVSHLTSCQSKSTWEHKGRCLSQCSSWFFLYSAQRWRLMDVKMFKFQNVY